MVSKLKVLLVDDEPRVLRSLKAALKKDFEILVANDASQAQEILNSNSSINVLVTDEKMPNITGTQLIHWVNEHHPVCKCIMLTGMPKVNEIKSKLALNDYSNCLSKPWDNKELIECIYRAHNQVRVDSLTDHKEDKIMDISHNLSLIIHNPNDQIIQLGQEIKHKFSNITNVFETRSEQDIFNEINKHHDIEAVLINHDEGDVTALIEKLDAKNITSILLVSPSFAMTNTIEHAQVLTKPLSLFRLEPEIIKLF